MPPELSVVVCTRNRSAQLRRCLAAFAQQEAAPHRWQLIIVDNGSTDETPEIVKAFGPTVPFAVFLVLEPKPGQGRARNRGVWAAGAPLIAFTDDDCYPASDFVDEVVRAFQRPECYGYIGGRIVLHDVYDAPETIRDDLDPEEIRPYQIVTPGSIQGANLAFRRSVWAAINGFDEGFGPGTPFVCDDIDFVTRASLAGYRGAYLPEPVVAHHHGRKFAPAVRKLHASYAKARGAYYMKGCLRSNARGQFARQWYWHLRTQIRDRRFGELARELAAGVEYAIRATLP